MTNINKSFKCAECSTDFPVSVTTDLAISDMTIVSNCPKCGNAMQIHFGVISGPAQAQPAAQPPQPSLDDSMSMFMPPEMPSDEIKKLIED